MSESHAQPSPVYIAVCRNCLSDVGVPSVKPQLGLLQPLPIPAERLKHWVIDFAVGLPRTLDGNESVLVMVDRKTRYTLLRPCPAKCTAETAVKILLDATAMLGTPMSVVWDPDNQFKLATVPFQTTLKALGCEVHVGTVDHHDTVGLAERTIQSIKEQLRHYVNATHTYWAELLAPPQNALNNAYCESIHTTPNNLSLGMHPDQPRMPTPNSPSDFALWRSG